MTDRASLTTTYDLPDAAIVGGVPLAPSIWQHSDSATTATQGSGHIECIPNPNPTVAPDYSWIYPPPATPSAPSAGQFYRWVVDDLPDPAGFPDGFYWLGDPSPYDGTSGITSAAQQWKCNNHATGPAWRSFYPFKPSVSSINHYLFGGDEVTHPKGVNFNAHYVEHMWLDWGSDHPQPFTWVIAAMMTHWPDGYTQRILDAGRNPDDVGFPRLLASDTDVTRLINDGLSYRSLLASTPSHLAIASDGSTKQAVAGADTHLRPKMFFGVYNGTSSYTGSFDPGIQRYSKGKIATGTALKHRYYVLGRRQGVISQDSASHMLVFELRYWTAALTRPELTTQFNQLSSTYKMARYYR